MRRYRFKQSRGVAMLEFAMVFPIYLMAMLCFLQLVLMIHARFILNYAAFAAARAGIVYNARQSDMNYVVASIMSAHWRRVQNGNGEWMFGQGRANVEMATGNLTVTVLEPSNVNARLRAGNSLTTTLNASERNLTVRVTWNYPLLIPVANSIFMGFFNNVPTPNWSGPQPGPYLGGRFNPGPDPRIPLWADYTLRIATMNPNRPYHD